MWFPQGRSKLVAECRLKRGLLPTLAATALLTLPTVTRDSVCCSVTDSSITDTLAPACLPIPVPVSETAHTAFLHTGSHAHVGPHGLEWPAQVSLPGPLYCVGTLVPPAARPPPSASALPTLGMKGTEQT